VTLPKSKASQHASACWFHDYINSNKIRLPFNDNPIQQSCRQNLQITQHLQKQLDVKEILHLLLVNLLEIIPTKLNISLLHN